jgi:ribonuclease HII
MGRGPDFSFEAEAMSRGARLVCGIDEAGRGPWAGPVVAAAVILDAARIPEGLDDSKKLTETQRELLFDPIMAVSQVGVGIVGAREIDEVNILQATYRAMAQAVTALPSVPDLALVDGNRRPPLACACQTIIKGDGRSLSIAAASIIAKVTRDRLMRDLDAVYPGYGLARHKGYGTAAHSAALARLGPCAEHRMSFAPLRALVQPGSDGR